MVAVNGEVVFASRRRRVRRPIRLRVNVLYIIDEVLDCDGVVSEMCLVVDSWISLILRAKIGNVSCGGG